MQLRYFVSLCSIALLAWLGLTFVHEVPTHRYQKAQVSVQAEEVQKLSPVQELELAEEAFETMVENDELAVSVSP